LNISTNSAIVLAVVVKQFKYTIMENSLWEMNHYVTLGIVAIVAAMTLTAVGFAIPQQALAYRHHNNHNNNNNSIKVDQQVNQLNDCTTPPPPPPPAMNKTGDSSLNSGSSSSSSGTVCLNSGDNSADIHK
jgi:hypothetical protein